jgi:hypothetical protein
MTFFSLDDLLERIMNLLQWIKTYLLRGDNRAGRVRFEFGRVRSGKFDQKNYRVTGRVRVNLIRVESGFRSNIVRFFWVSGHFGLGRVGFRVLSSSGHLRFRVIRFQVGSGFRSSDIG